MQKINMNTLAKDVSIEEGKVKEVNIAQIKEVIHHTLWQLSNMYKPSQVMELIERFDEGWE